MEAAVATAAVVRCRELQRRFGEGSTAVEALAGIDLEFPRGELTAIVGPSGSGKSTLMHVLAGLDHPTGGRVWIEDDEVTGLGDAELTRLRRDKLGFVFQFFNLVPVLSAEENIALPLRIAGRRPDEGWLGELIGRVGLAERRDHRPSELSGGQQQRVAIARALASRPAVVFADEPTGNLDSKSGTGVLELLRSAVDEFGQTVVMVTHDPRVAAYADRVVVLTDGRVSADARPEDEGQVVAMMRDL